MLNFFEMETTLKKNIPTVTITGEQKQFISYKGDDSLILSSVAGSGKTFSCVHRLKYLIKNGADPKKIIFFSFTNAAVDELRERIGNNDVKICTIHSFCYSVLGTMKKYKEMMGVYDFIFWYKKEKEPAARNQKKEFAKRVERMFEEAERIASEISTYKLNKAINLKSKLPDHYMDYCSYQKVVNKYDFADLLIQTYKATKDPTWRTKFAGMYDHVFCDEYQDTSIIQLEILLQLKSKQYYLIGDRNQSIFGFSGSNCNLLESRLKKFKTVTYFNLTNNFRSAKIIVDNSNKYSQLQAVHTKTHEGYIDYKFITYEELRDLIINEDEIAVLARTNAVIKDIEFLLLKDKVKMRYFNYLTDKEIENYKSGNINFKLKSKINALRPFFKNEDSIFGFIETNKESKKFITSIHKSKGREFENTVLVNSFSEEVIAANDIKFDKEELKRISFNVNDKDYEESKNIHYVGISRAKSTLRFCYWPEN